MAGIASARRIDGGKAASAAADIAPVPAILRKLRRLPLFVGFVSEVMSVSGVQACRAMSGRTAQGRLGGGRLTGLIRLCGAGAGAWCAVVRIATAGRQRQGGGTQQHGSQPLRARQGWEKRGHMRSRSGREEARDCGRYPDRRERRPMPCDRSVRTGPVAQVTAAARMLMPLFGFLARAKCGWAAHPAPVQCATHMPLPQMG